MVSVFVRMFEICPVWKKRRCLRILWSTPMFYPHTGFIHGVDIEEVTPPTVKLHGRCHDFRSRVSVLEGSLSFTPRFSHSRVGLKYIFQTDSSGILDGFRRIPRPVAAPAADKESDEEMFWVSETSKWFCAWWYHPPQPKKDPGNLHFW